jgi:hypothetical protein
LPARLTLCSGKATRPCWADGTPVVHLLARPYIRQRAAPTPGTRLRGGHVLSDTKEHT